MTMHSDLIFSDVGRGVMNKRYQVFLSSTYDDLEEERKKVIRTLMEMDCIPAGMEAFPAVDEKQWEFIKKVIDDSDYYVLLIGGRYGSLSPEGIGYTEKEYDYAVKKGIDIIAILHGAPEKIKTSKTDSDKELKCKLENFREKVKKNGMVKYWYNADEIPGIVALSLNRVITINPAEGWVRSNTLSSEEDLLDLRELEKEKEKLEDLIRKTNKSPLNTLYYVSEQFDQLAELGAREEMAKKGDRCVLSYLSTLGNGEREAAKQRLLDYVVLFNKIGHDIKDGALDKDIVFNLWAPSFFEKHWQKFKAFLVSEYINLGEDYSGFQWLATDECPRQIKNYPTEKSRHYAEQLS